MNPALAELGLEQITDDVIVRPMLTLEDAIDLYLGDLQRAGRRDRTRDTYGRYLGKFADTLPQHWDVAKIGADECRRFLDKYTRHAENTRFQVWSILHCFFRWLYHTERIKRSPMERIMPPRKPDPMTLEVKSVETDVVPVLLTHAHTHTERLSVAIPAWTSARRSAAAHLLVSDYDRKEQTLRFIEKGGEVIRKPVPGELVTLIEARLTALPAQPDDYLIPVETGGGLRRDGTRDTRVVYNAVKRVMKRAGVDAHVHALRAAFAVRFEEAHPERPLVLQDMMGHKQFATTEVYLRRRKRELGMEVVRDLSYSPQIAEKRMETSS